MGASVKLIKEDSLRVVEDGFTFDVRLNWYRSLPLSSVDVLKVSIDGEQVPAGQILFEINDHQYPLTALVNQFEEFWFVQDFARLHVRQTGKINQGESHTLEAEISLRFPYMMIGPGKFLTNVTANGSTQVAQ
jgi:hypothetical protein